jgi:hypothetical protein
LEVHCRQKADSAQAKIIQKEGVARQQRKLINSLFTKQNGNLTAPWG